MSETPRIEAEIELTGWQEVELVYERLAEKGEKSFERVDEAARDNGTAVRESARAVQGYSQTVSVSVQQQAEAVGGFFTRLQAGAAAVAESIRGIALAATVTTVGLGAAFTAGYVGLSNFADSTAKETVAWVTMADAAGVAVEALGRYEYMAGVAAGSSDLVGSSFKQVTDLLIRFRENAADEGAVKPFRQLGLEAELVGGKFKSAEDVFARVEEQLRLIPDSALRSKAAFDLFGAGAKELLPVFSKNAAELAKLKEEAVKLGESKREDLDLAKTTKLLEDKNRLSIAIDGLKDAVGSAFFPVLAKGTDATAKFINDNMEKIEEYIEDAADKFEKLQDDFYKLFEQPKQDRRLNVEIDGRGIDFTKARLKELVEAARAGQIGVDQATRVKPSLKRPVDGEEEGEGEDGEEGSGAVEAATAQAAELKSVRLSELYDFVAIAGRKIQVDRETQKGFIDLDGKRVLVTRENSALILKGLANDAEAALKRQTASNADAVKLNYSFMKILVAPAQELRAIALDLWDAISGEGLGDRSRTVAIVSSAWQKATGYLVEFRDGLLGIFGLTTRDLPTMGQAFDKVLAALTSFKQGLFGDRGKAEIPWAQSAGKGVAYLGEVLWSVWTVTKAVFGFVAPYVVASLNIVADAFRAVASYIQGTPIADDNTFAWVQKYIPQIEEFFASVKSTVTEYVDIIKGKLKDWFGDITWDDVKGAAIKTFDIIVGAAVIAYNTIAGTFRILKKVFDVLITPIDIIAKLLGFDGWKSAAFTYFVAKLFLASAAGTVLMNVLSSIFFAILPGLILGLLGVVGLVGLLIGLFGAVPIAMAAAVAAAIAACLAGFALLARVAYVFGDDIKAAFGKAADWVLDKWMKIKGLVVGAAKAVRKALGLGGDDEPEAPAAAPADAAGPATEKAETKERAPTDYVLGTDGQYRSAEDEEERTRPEWMRKKSPVEDNPITVASYTGETSVWDGLTGQSLDDNAAGHVGPKEAFPQVGGASMSDTLRDLSARMKDLTAELGKGTPFSLEPPVLPQGKGGMGGLAAIPVEIDPTDKRIFGTPAAAEDLMEKLRQAGVAVRTGRPRAN